jgi:hypothetical protein
MNTRTWLLLWVLVASVGCSGTATQATTPAPPAPFNMVWSSLVFPNTAVGATSSAAVAIGLWNTGSTSVPVTSVSDTNSVEFPWSTTCAVASVLPPNSNCAVTIQFNPSATGARSATLTINANASSQTFSLAGTGTLGATPQLTVGPKSGSSSTSFVLTLTGATPSGPLTLHTTYVPAPGLPGTSIASTTWTADSSGNVTVTSIGSAPGTYEVWFVDVASGLSTNHVLYSVQ